MGGSPSGSSTSQQTSEPWAAQQPYLKRGFAAAQQEFDSSRPEYFPDSTVVPFSPESEAALAASAAQATDPGSLVNLAGTETGRTLRGEYLQSGNPIYDEMLTGVRRQVQPQVDSSFARAGRGAGAGGSPGHSEALGRGISQGMLPFINAERGRQMGATQTALPVSQYAPGLLAGVGAAREGKAGEEVGEDIARHDFGQYAQANKIREFIANVTGNYGGTTTSTRPTYSNPLMTGLGAATSIAGLGSSLFAPVGGGGVISGNK